MFVCRFCPFKTKKLTDHLEHRKFHSNLNSNFSCGFNGCQKIFKLERSWRSHLLRTHSFRFRYENKTEEPKSNARLADPNTKYHCSIQLCKKEFDRPEVLLKHLKSHIKYGARVGCPFQNCAKSYDKVSSFTSHLSKNHSRTLKATFAADTNSLNEQNDLIHDDVVELECSNEEGGDYPMAEDADGIKHNQENVTDLFLLHLAGFFLKLETQFLLPVATIQYIVSQIYNMHEMGQEVVKQNILQRLSKDNIPSDQSNDIIQQAFLSDPFLNSKTKLGTAFKRREFYKQNFSYVKPVKIWLGDKNNKKKFFHYVPLQKTIQKLFENKSFDSELQGSTNLNDDDVLKDFTDGSVFKENPFFAENPEALKLILYQDSFEVVNPLGSAKTKHKILAVYLNIGNLPDHIRSHVNSMQLVALCKEKLFDHEKVYGRIVEDLKKIETAGVKLSSGKVIKGSVVFIAGDNLGSHALGGFVENFSSSAYFCRYCLMKRSEFNSTDGALKSYERRTIRSYKKIIALHKKKSKNLIVDFDNQGIKFNSLFNELVFYHVCAPGLPPCLGHDMLEGITANDLCLIIKELVKKKWFSYETLNKRIESFKYSIVDHRDTPCTIPSTAKKITGSAWQIRTFLRLFPLMVEDKIRDIHDPLWRSVILLGEIVEIICAPEIHKSCIYYLKLLIHEYIELRQQLSRPLRPKHHFLLHYPELILQFGPLMKVWTLRFESKHTFFKRVVRNIKNFINVTKSLSVKHELFQSFVRSGGDIRSELEMKSSTDFRSELYNENIQTALHTMRLPDDIQECNEIIARGVSYRKGSALFVACEGYQYNVEVGKVILLLCDEVHVIVVVEVLETTFIPHLRAYKLGKLLRYQALDLKSLPSTESLHIYNMGTFLCVKPNYALVRGQL